MPLTYTIDPERRLVTAVASGRVTPEEATAKFDEIMAHPYIVSGVKLLSDHRALHAVLPTGFVHGMVRRIHTNRELFEGCRWAFVESGVARYGMARMAAILLELSPVELRVFRHIDKAREWLELSEAAEPDE
jgi:hypothetical protein